MIIAVAAIVLAGTLLWRRHVDAAFVVAALGMVAWFLNYRRQMKRIIATADANETDEGETEEGH